MLYINNESLGKKPSTIGHFKLTRVVYLIHLTNMFGYILTYLPRLLLIFLFIVLPTFEPTCSLVHYNMLLKNFILWKVFVQ